MWKCKSCGEEHDDDFDACRKCLSNKDGGIPNDIPKFQLDGQSENQNRKDQNCTNCGTLINSGDSFCTECGQPAVSHGTGGNVDSKTQKKKRKKKILLGVTVFLIGFTLYFFNYTESGLKFRWVNNIWDTGAADKLHEKGVLVDLVWTYPGVFDELERIGDQPTVDALILLLKEKDVRGRDVRGRAALALGRIGDPRAVEPLAALLHDEDGDFRRTVVEALGQIGHQTVIEPLLSVLNDEDMFVRDQAFYWLGRIGDERAIDALVSIILEHGGMLDSKLVNALVDLGPPVIAPLINLLKDSFEGLDTLVFIRHHSIMSPYGTVQKVFFGIGSPSVQPLVDLLSRTSDRGLQLRVAYILKDFDSTLLLPYLESPSTVKVYMALILKGENGTEDALIEAMWDYGHRDDYIIRDFLNTGNAKLRDAAERWCQRYGHRIVTVTGDGIIPKWGTD